MRLTEPPRRLAEIRPEIPWSPAVQAVMDRALQRDAALRYASASEFGRALSAAVHQQPTAFPATATLPPESAEAELSVPPTRISESAGTSTSAAAPVALERQRWPLMASAGALVVVLLVVGALFAFSRKAGTEGGPTGTSPADQAPAAPSMGTPIAPSGTAAGAAVKPVAASNPTLARRRPVRHVLGAAARRL